MKPLHQFITEDILGKCWHEIETGNFNGFLGKCKKCQQLFHAIHFTDWNPDTFNTNYTSPPGWWELWNWAREQEDWNKFLEWLEGTGILLMDAYAYLVDDIEKFPTAYAKFKGWKE